MRFVAALAVVAVKLEHSLLFRLFLLLELLLDMNLYFSRTPHKLFGLETDLLLGWCVVVARPRLSRPPRFSVVVRRPTGAAPRAISSR